MNSNQNVYRKKNNRQNNRKKGRSNPNKTPLAPMARQTTVTTMKKNGDLHNKIFNKNQVITAGAWDLFSLSSIAKGTGEDERIGNKILSKEVRYSLSYFIGGSVSETAHRRVRVVEVIVNYPTTPGNSNWVTTLFFDGLNAGINSLIDYDVKTFNRKRFHVISDRVFNLNSIKQAENVTRKYPLNYTT
jgi:hypothetical protein